MNIQLTDDDFRGKIEGCTSRKDLTKAGPVQHRGCVHSEVSIVKYVDLNGSSGIDGNEVIIVRAMVAKNG